MPKSPLDLRTVAWQGLWFNPWWWISYAALTLGFSFRLEGARHVPRRGPVLLISNHQSFFDPIVLGVAARRPLIYLSRKTLFRPPWFGWFIHSLGAVPVDQEGVAKEGLRAILKHLEAGAGVVVFPEGTRTETGALSPLKPGIQLLLRRAQMTLVPAGIAGAFEALPYWEKVPKLAPLLGEPRRSSIAVSVGRPLDAARYADMPREQMLAELTAELQKLKDRAERLRRKK